jgi:ketosteroid isomerase-like protein
MKRIVMFAIGAVIVVASGCTMPKEVDTGAEAAALQKVDEQWSAAAAKNDLDATVAFYADGAVVLPGNSPIVTDAKAVRGLWAELLAPGNSVSWKVTKAEVAKSGELGYVYGTYELTVKDPKGGPGEHDKGKLVEIWKKQADGNWKCIVDTYNSDLAPPTTAAPKK